MGYFKKTSLVCVCLFSLWSGATEVRIKDLKKEKISAIKSLLSDYTDGLPEFVIACKLFDGVGLSKQDPKGAFDYFIKAAEKGYIPAVFSVAQMYRFGKGTRINLNESAQYMERAAHAHYDVAQTEFGKMLLEGLLGQGRSQEAFTWLHRAEENGESDAIAVLGILAQTGLQETGAYGEADYKKAFDYFKRAAEKKSWAAIFNLAQFYQFGLSGEKSLPHARGLFEEILHSTDKNAFPFIGFMYETGSGVDKDSVKAEEYYLLSEEATYKDFAMKRLEHMREKKLKHAQQASEKAAQELIQQEEREFASRSTKNKKKNKALKSREEICSPVSKESIHDPEIQAEDIDIVGYAIKDILNRILSYDDQSTITDITVEDGTIRINNPYDNSEIVITAPLEQPLEAEKIKKLKKFIYDKRLKNWFGNPEELLKNATQDSIERHRFAQRLDQIVQLYGVEADFIKHNGESKQNKILTGSFTRHGKTSSGIFTYDWYGPVDNEVLYHRFFTPHSKAEVVQPQ